jgi:hypothetical protein
VVAERLGEQDVSERDAGVGEHVGKESTLVGVEKFDPFCLGVGQLCVLFLFKLYFQIELAIREGGASAVGPFRPSSWDVAVTFVRRGRDYSTHAFKCLGLAQFGDATTFKGLDAGS